jgi:hypothetical protein
MDELSLGMECLAENEGEDTPVPANEAPSAGTGSGSAALSIDRSGSISFPNDSGGVPKRHSFDATGGLSSSNSAAIPGHKSMSNLGRPASMEFTPSGVAKGGRKGRLSMIISGSIDTITGIPIPEKEEDSNNVDHIAETSTQNVV